MLPMENMLTLVRLWVFIKDALRRNGYNVPEIIIRDMYSNGADGDLFSTGDPSYPQLDYYETFNDEKALDIARDYINTMKQEFNGELLASNDDYRLPDNINSLEDFKR